MIHALHARQVDRYFAGSLRPAAVDQLFQRLWRCGPCRVRYERHLLHERILPDGDGRQQDRLWRSILASAVADPRPAATVRPGQDVRRRGRRLFTLVGLGAVASALLIVAVGSRRQADPVARGGSVEAAVGPTVHFFRSVGEHQTQSVTETIHADDGILVAYSNPGVELSYLMIFAVDVRGAVHWYYPAYEEQGQNPSAPAIRTRALGVELGEEIRHALPIGPLRMFALFLRQPLRVEEVERLVTEAWRSDGESVTALETLPIEDGAQLSRVLDVIP